MRLIGHGLCRRWAGCGAAVEARRASSRIFLRVNGAESRCPGDTARRRPGASFGARAEQGPRFRVEQSQLSTRRRTAWGGSALALRRVPLRRRRRFPRQFAARLRMHMCGGTGELRETCAVFAGWKKAPGVKLIDGEKRPRWSGQGLGFGQQSQPLAAGAGPRRTAHLSIRRGEQPHCSMFFSTEVVRPDALLRSRGAVQHRRGQGTVACKKK